MNYAKGKRKMSGKMIAALMMSGVLLGPFGAIAGAEPITLGEWELDPRLDATAVFSPGRADAGATAAEVFAAQLRAELRLERVLDNGVEIGARLGGRVQLDHPARSGFSGRIGEGVAIFDDLAPRGAFTGLTLGGVEEDFGAQAQLETAFVYADGGYGEILAGRDVGVARRFHEGSPSVFRFHRITNASLDTSGIATALTRNDLTGPAAKVSYASPRILGLRFGASYTPRANVSGLDRDPDRDAVGIAEPRLDNGAEAALNFTHRFRGTGLRVQAYGAYGRADLETGPMRVETGTVEVWSLGGELEWEGFELGADWLTTDNGGGRYKAWSIGGKKKILGLDISAEYAQSRDDLIDIDGRSWSLGVSKLYFERLTLGGGLQRQSLDSELMSGQNSLGPVIEITLRY